MADTTTLADISRKTLDDHQKAVTQWATQTGVKTAAPARGLSTAQGKITFGGAIANAVLIELTFDSGEKRNFNGVLFGVAGGYTDGAGIYIGVMPNDGDQWNMTMMGVDVGVGGLQVNFNPVWGPAGCLTCASTGAMAAAGPVMGVLPATYGGGHWRNG